MPETGACVPVRHKQQRPGRARALVEGEKSAAVDHILQFFFGLAFQRFGLALEVLQLAFALQLFVIKRTAGFTLGLAGGFVVLAFQLVSCTGHDRSSLY